MRRVWMRLRSRGGQAGAGGESLELLIIAPIVLAIFLAAVAVGRYQLGSGKIDQAAGAGARAASQQLTQDAAHTAALEAAESSLTAAGVTCQGITVSVDTGGYQAAAAGAAQVQVTVTCGVSWSDLTIPGWPGSKTITSQATSPLDLKKIGT